MKMREGHRLEIKEFMKGRASEGHLKQIIEKKLPAMTMKHIEELYHYLAENVIQTPTQNHVPEETEPATPTPWPKEDQP